MRNVAAILAFMTLLQLRSDRPVRGQVRGAAGTIRQATPRAAPEPWTYSQTDNFRVWSPFSQRVTNALGAHCEELRHTLSRYWLSAPQFEAWTPRCDVIVYSSAKEYEAALGPNVIRSKGTTLLERSSGAISHRRIDLRADVADWHDSVLPHEITHVIMAGDANDAAPPPWADEGMAVLAESPPTLDQRFAALIEHGNAVRHFSLKELVTLRPDQLPDNTLRAAFYAESAVLVDLLSTLRSSQQFVDFVRNGTKSGYESALNRFYGIASWTELEVHFTAHVSAMRQCGSGYVARAAWQSAGAPSKRFLARGRCP